MLVASLKYIPEWSLAALPLRPPVFSMRLSSSAPDVMRNGTSSVPSPRVKAAESVLEVNVALAASCVTVILTGVLLAVLIVTVAASGDEIHRLLAAVLLMPFVPFFLTVL